MGNFTLTLPAAQRVRKFKSQIQKGGSCANVTQEVTEFGPPLECAQGDRIILFLKNPALTVDGSGAIVGSIITRALVAGNYEYYVSYNSNLLVPNVQIDQCDVIKQCCYDCQTEYLCLLMAHPNCEAIQDCVGQGFQAANGLYYDDGANLFSVAISAEGGNTIVLMADGLYATTQVEGEIDCTLRRNGGGILGVANNPFPVAGHSFTFGFDSDACGIRIPEVSAIAVMSGESTTQGPIAPSTQFQIDFDTEEWDPLGMIAPGADWTCTVPYDGRYVIDVGVLYENSIWGGFGTTGKAGINLDITINGGAPQHLATRTVWDEDPERSAAVHIAASRMFNLSAGDVIRVETLHSDNNVPDDTHGLIGGPWSYFNIHRVL